MKFASRLARIGYLLVAILAYTTTNAVAADFWVLSANAADRPPVMSPDVASRTSDPDRPPSYGPEDAKVLIVLFSDYQCPSCRRVTQATHQISAEFPDEVRIEVWHHALAMHSKAESTAAAAVAAQNQGKFWEMHDLIFQNQDSLDVPDLEQHAQALGLDMDRFRKDMSDPAIRQRIQEEGALADALGAPATPGWVINGKASQGWGSWNAFRTRVAREVDAAKELAAQGMDAKQIREHRAIDNLTDSESYELYRSNILASERTAK
jgi:protein-disulfide isomerase